MEEIKILYLVRSSESGGFVHISEKDVLEESDAMDAKLVLALHHHDSLQSLINTELKVSVKAINKFQELTLDVMLLPSDNGNTSDCTLCSVNTPYGFCWFKLKKFNNYVGQKLRGIKIFDLEPLSDTMLEELCLKYQFFFVGS